jgi:RHS repeat-associated protein
MVLHYLHTDHLGTPRRATDSTGTVVWSWDSDAFGSTAANEDPDGDGVAAVVNLRFPGQVYDDETALHYNYFRYYDPSTGRYITSDPIGLRGGLNTYGYVGGNPVNLMDPYGLATTMVCRPLSGIMGLTGARHCSVVVWHEECGRRVIDRQYSLTYGDTRPLRPGSPDATYTDDTNAFNNPGGGNDHYDIPVPPGMTPQQFDNNIIQTGDNYTQGTYDPLGIGNNSNTAADNIIEYSGGDAPDVWNAPGQNYGDL